MEILKCPSVFLFMSVLFLSLCETARWSWAWRLCCLIVSWTTSWSLCPDHSTLWLVFSSSYLSSCLSDCFLSIHPFLLLLLSVSRPTIWSGSLSLCCTTSPTWRRRFWMRWSCSQRTTTGTRNMSWRKWTPAWWETCSTHYCWNKNSKAVTSPPSWNFYFVKESKSCFSSSDDS